MNDSPSQDDGGDADGWGTVPIRNDERRTVETLAFGCPAGEVREPDEHVPAQHSPSQVVS